MENPGHFAFEELLAGIDDAAIANMLPELANNNGYVPPYFNDLDNNLNLDYGADLQVAPLPSIINQMVDAA